MNIRNTEPCQDQKTGSVTDAMSRYGLGRTTMCNLAKEAGAVVRVGRRYLINFGKVDAYMDEKAQ